MNLLHIVDLKDGRIHISWQCGNALARAYEHPLPFADPLTPNDRAELRWYLEDYLQFPYGAERDRAAKAEQQMAQWGEALFQQVFAKGDRDPEPRMFFQEAVREGLEQCEISISSEDPTFLNIPWELVRDPTPGRGYLAPLLAGLYRQRSGYKIEATAQSSSDGPFRILLVIARPGGEQDIPLGTVARPVLEAVRPLRPQVELEVLRPPTFDALVARLNEQRGKYDLVHFDGHGVFAGASSGFQSRYSAMAGYGHLAFEREDGQPHIVNSQDLGQALATSKVPLFVLNACQSAEEGPANPFSSVASQLIAIGSKGVVAMSYSVYASTAALFMRRFYQRLIEHASLSEAVAAARLSLFSDAFRQSPIGPLEVRDWLVPALYQQERTYTPIPPGTRANIPEEKQALVAKKSAEQVCPEGRFGFVGRDNDLLRIERALRKDDTPWVLLVGMGGSGKTQLAYGFARWYAETGGCPGGVFATSFKEKASWGQVVGSIAGYGTDFSRLPESEQWDTLLKHLRENPCLLIWDNLETVAGYPQGTSGLATEEERGKLARWLQALRGGKSRVIITTRKPEEPWLGIAYQLLEVKGLTPWNAAELAERILRTVGRRPHDFADDPEYSHLLRLLRGHPRSLEVVLPRLRYEAPAAIINALQHRIDTTGDVLDASLTYVFHQLSERAQKHLPVIGLFTSYVRVEVVVGFLSSGDDQETVYREVVGETLDAAGWKAVLEEAAAAGLVSSIGNPAYELHPTLPGFLRHQLVARFGAKALERLDHEFMRYYAAWSSHCLEATQNGEENVVAAVSIEEANLLRALQLAQLSESWEETLAIVQTLDEFYEIGGRDDERNALRRQLLQHVGYELPPSAGRDRANLWMFLLSNEAIHLLTQNDVETAQAIYERMLGHLLEFGDPKREAAVSVVYHQLGMIALRRHQLGQAEAWYHKSLEISAQLGLDRGAAGTYQQLGVVAQERGQLSQAEAWYHKTLEIRERLGPEREAVGCYHQLGRLAEERQQFDQAEAWYRQALEISERIGLDRDAAGAYLQLGVVAQERGRFDQAEAWYRKALEIYERLRLERNAAAAYHQLGMVAAERQQLDQAEAWYCKALEIRERFGLERDAAGDYQQLGVVAQERQQLQQAEAWYRQALEISERIGLERNAAAAYHQLGRIAEDRKQFDQAEARYRQALEISERLGYTPARVNTLAQLGVLRRKQNRLDEALMWYGRALEIASQYHMRVATQILAHITRLLQVMGEQAFVASWTRSFPDTQPPLQVLRDILKQLESQEGSK